MLVRRNGPHQVASWPWWKGPRPRGFSPDGRKEDGAYAPLRGPSQLDRPRHKERRAHHRAHGPRRRARREARVGVGAGLLDRRSLRYAHRLRGARRGGPERLPPGDRLFGQPQNHHTASLRRGGDVRDTQEARLSLSTSESPRRTSENAVKRKFNFREPNTGEVGAEG